MGGRSSPSTGTGTGICPCSASLVAISSLSPAVLLGGILLAAACGTATLPRPALAAGGPFAALTGAWGGNGTIQPGNGTTERIRCNANYRPRGSSGAEIDLDLRCASDSYNFDLTGQFSADDGNRITGQWTERTRNIGGSVIGTVRGDRLQVHVESSRLCRRPFDGDARPPPERYHRLAGRRTDRQGEHHTQPALTACRGRGPHGSGHMEYRARYVLIGAFALLCLFAGFGFVYWIKNVGGLGQRAIYNLRFEQSVSGLGLGAGVLFNGIRVGTVTAVNLDPAHPKRITATISVDPSTPVRADTKVGISFQGLTGATAISLTGGAPDAPKLTGDNGNPPAPRCRRRRRPQPDGVGAGHAAPPRHHPRPECQAAEHRDRRHRRIRRHARQEFEAHRRPLGGLENLTGTGTPKAGPAIYDLAAASDFPPAATTIKAQLAVPDPNAIILFDSQKILIRAAGGTYSSIDNAQWADNLPKLVQARIVQSFENAHQLGGVSRPLEQLNADYRLELGIRSFYIEPPPSPKAMVEITARIVSDKGAVAEARIFNASAPAKSTDAADATAALNQAFDDGGQADRRLDGGEAVTAPAFTASMVSSLSICRAISASATSAGVTPMSSTCQ